MLAERGSDKTVCPSEVARRLAGDAEGWREQMPVVHAAVDRLLDKDVVALSWRGQALSRRAGPYRIGMAAGT